MKKVLAFGLAALFTLGSLWGCEKTEDAGVPGSSAAKELVSKVHYSVSSERNGQKSDSEMVMNFTWNQDGALMEGYELEHNSRNNMRLEATYDDQNRPLSMSKTYQYREETETTNIHFSYPTPLQIQIHSTNSNGFTQDIAQTYDENGRVILAVYPDYTRGFEFDSQGNCTREWMQYEDEELTDWESNTVYTYDDAGKVTLAVQTRSDNGFEEQQHYYYYPNGNVMAIMYVTSHGDTSFGFRPYNTKDYLGWGFGRAASGGFTCHAEKNEQGLITKVTRTNDFSDEIQTATFDYDARGNLIREVSYYGTVYTWEYDAQNRIVKAVEDQRTSSPQTVYTTLYEYDSQGRLISTQRTGTNGASDIETLTYNEYGMVTERTSRSVSIYADETVVYQRKLTIEYVENSQCTVNDTWVDFFSKAMINGL